MIFILHGSTVYSFVAMIFHSMYFMDPQFYSIFPDMPNNELKTTFATCWQPVRGYCPSMVANPLLLCRIIRRAQRQPAHHFWMHHHMGRILPGSTTAILSSRLSNLLSRWLRLRQAPPGQTFQQYIEVFTKLRLQLQIKDSEEVLVIKFNSGL